MTTRRNLLFGAAAALLAGAGYAAGSRNAAVQAARERVSRSSDIMQSRFGRLEYAIAGRGEPLMMIHGTGGGFDQGIRFGRSLIARGFQVIAPSRFGYLRSDFPDHPTPANQADALVDLLDHLGIERLAIAGGSAGALSAAQFALRHPDRCSHLALLVPAANLANEDPVAFTPLQSFIVERVLASDTWFWVLLKIAPNQLMRTLLATDPALLASVPAEERQRARLILEDLMPIRDRARGMLNDARSSGSPANLDFSRIGTPTLVISVEDDLFGTAETARRIAALIPSARLLVYPEGGHIWLGHNDEIASEIASFVRRGTG